MEETNAAGSEKQNSGSATVPAAGYLGRKKQTWQRSNTNNIYNFDQSVESTKHNVSKRKPPASFQSIDVDMSSPSPALEGP